MTPRVSGFIPSDINEASWSVNSSYHDKSRTDSNQRPYTEILTNMNAYRQCTYIHILTYILMCTSWYRYELLLFAIITIRSYLIISVHLFQYFLFSLDILHIYNALPLSSCTASNMTEKFASQEDYDHNSGLGFDGVELLVEPLRHPTGSVVTAITYYGTDGAYVLFKMLLLFFFILSTSLFLTHVV